VEIVLILTQTKHHMENVGVVIIRVTVETLMISHVETSVDKDKASFDAYFL
jgi:hypothetical protein